MSSPCPILTPINLYHSSPRFLTTIQSSWNTQPHARQSIEAQRTSWGQGCSPTFVVKSLPFRGNSAPFRVTPLPLCTSLTLIFSMCSTCLVKAKAHNLINFALETILSRYFTNHMIFTTFRDIVGYTPVTIKYSEHLVSFLTIILSAHITWDKCQNYFLISSFVALYSICFRSQYSLSQTSFGHIFINSLTISMGLIVPESP